MAKSIPLLILLALISTTTALFWCLLDDILASTFVAATICLSISPFLMGRGPGGGRLA